MFTLGFTADFLLSWYLVTSSSMVYSGSEFALKMIPCSRKSPIPHSSNCITFRTTHIVTGQFPYNSLWRMTQGATVSSLTYFVKFSMNNFKWLMINITPVLGNVSKMDTPVLDQESQNHDPVGQANLYRNLGGGGGGVTRGGHYQVKSSMNIFNVLKLIWRVLQHNLLYDCLSGAYCFMKRCHTPLRYVKTRQHSKTYVTWGIQFGSKKLHK